MSGAPDLSKLRWRCRRGTKELDTLTTRYLEHFYSSASQHEQSAFAQLLTLQDPELHEILTRDKQVNDPHITAIVGKIHSI
ncbi:MAG: succinate dehydrogenase assembly factor 2 [Gammaproteobacteria bacterium]|nr:succinate dehydrogenase assembly factor 2 [Gammaproteobacteria bacterium]